MPGKDDDDLEEYSTGDSEFDSEWSSEEGSSDSEQSETTISTETTATTATTTASEAARTRKKLLKQQEARLKAREQELLARAEERRKQAEREAKLAAKKKNKKGRKPPMEDASSSEEDVPQPARRPFNPFRTLMGMGQPPPPEKKQSSPAKRKTKVIVKKKKGSADKNPTNKKSGSGSGQGGGAGAGATDGSPPMMQQHPHPHPHPQQTPQFLPPPLSTSPPPTAPSPHLQPPSALQHPPPQQYQPHPYPNAGQPSTAPAGFAPGSPAAGSVVTGSGLAPLIPDPKPDQPKIFAFPALKPIRPPPTKFDWLLRMASLLQAIFAGAGTAVVNGLFTANDGHFKTTTRWDMMFYTSMYLSIVAGLAGYWCSKVKRTNTMAFYGYLLVGVMVCLHIGTWLVAGRDCKKSTTDGTVHCWTSLDDWEELEEVEHRGMVLAAGVSLVSQVFGMLMAFLGRFLCKPLPQKQDHMVPLSALGLPAARYV